MDFITKNPDPQSLYIDGGIKRHDSEYQKINIDIKTRAKNGKDNL
jgi:hypothetical protein